MKSFLETLSNFESQMKLQLDQRKIEQGYRTLDAPLNGCDFSSNDYLGLAHSASQHNLVMQKYMSHVSKTNPPYLGSTGSRLLSGNSTLHMHLELYLSRIHNRPAALLCNSGYDANLSLLSSIPLPYDFIILDELIHNSLIMGVKMSRIPMEQVIFFRHNDAKHLREVLIEVQSKLKVESRILVVVESVYSMDGDIAPLEDILNISNDFGASVIVDEAHGLGVYGPSNITDLPSNITCMKIIDSKDDKSIGGTGVINALKLERHPALLATCYTFGKAAGAHGACIVGSEIVIEYLINYARPFVYSTSLPSHSLWTIKCSYDAMIGTQGDSLRAKLFHLVKLFRDNMRLQLLDGSLLLPSSSPIQAVLCKGNDRCIAMANRMKRLGISVYPIRSPTVSKGEERIRIIIHAHNTETEINKLVFCLVDCIHRDNHMLNFDDSSKL